MEQIVLCLLPPVPAAASGDVAKASVDAFLQILNTSTAERRLE